MSAFFRCDQCHKITDPRTLRKLVALQPLGKMSAISEDLHAGEICLPCIEKIKAKLPQRPKEESDAAQVVRQPE